MNVDDDTMVTLEWLDADGPFRETKGRRVVNLLPSFIHVEWNPAAGCWMVEGKALRFATTRGATRRLWHALTGAAPTF